MRTRLDLWLRLELDVEGYLREPTMDSPTDSELVDHLIGSGIGPYKVLQRLGEGGYGVVYMAEQRTPVTRKVR